MARRKRHAVIVSVISATLTGSAMTLIAAEGVNRVVIGMVASGPGQAGVLIDGARVSVNATVFEGSRVSASGYARLQLQSKTRVDLGADSTVRVFADREELEAGFTEVQSASAYEIDARSLRIQPSEADAVARVRLDGDQRVLVTALAAPVDVRNGDGVLVARVMPSKPMSFLPHAAAPTAFSNAGCVLQKSGAVVLADTMGNQIFELRSIENVADLPGLMGTRVLVTGVLLASPVPPPVAGATQVVSVTGMGSAAGVSSTKDICVAEAVKIGGTAALDGLVAGGPSGGTLGAVAAGSAPAGIASVGGGVGGVVIGGVAAGAGAAIGGSTAYFATRTTSP